MQIRTIAITFCLFAGVCVNSATADEPPKFVVEKGVRQLFLDDVGVERITNLKRAVEQPKRYADNPVIAGTEPWGKASTSVYGTAIYDPQAERFRIWYLSTPGPVEQGRAWVEVGGFRRVTNCTLIAYATSADGMRWERPRLGQLSFEGSRENNLVDIGIDNPEGISVLFDRHDQDPARRYKAFFWDRRVSPPADDAAKVPAEPPLDERQKTGGMWAATSADGVRWKTAGPVMPQMSDTTQSLVYDAHLKKYVVFGRFGFGRVVARSESDDFVTFSEPRKVLECDERDGPGGQIYGMPTDLYEGVYLGMFWMYREGGDARIDTQLATSRDGEHWLRVADRQTFLPNAPEGNRDDGMSRVVGRFIVRGDTIYLYYSMVNGPHRSAKFPMPERKFPPAIGLATLRRDGFVALQADQDGRPGTLITRPFARPQGRLCVNVDASAGEVAVTPCDEQGEPLAGAAAAVVRGDKKAAEVALAETAPDRPIRLRFDVRGARVYSYWFE